MAERLFSDVRCLEYITTEPLWPRQYQIRWLVTSLMFVLACKHVSQNGTKIALRLGKLPESSLTDGRCADRDYGVYTY